MGTTPKASVQTIKKIESNVIMANTVWKKLNPSLDFRKCFHLRPTSSGITIVSTLPYAPMRGLVLENSKELNDLEDILTQLIEYLPNLDVPNYNFGLKKLKKFSIKINGVDKYFKERNNKKSYKEELVQALFIRNMILGKYKINDKPLAFVASEFTFQRAYKMDVLGYDGETLYIFEIKKDADMKSIKQVGDYVRAMQINVLSNPSCNCLNIFNNYPNCSITNSPQIKGICLLNATSIDSNISDIISMASSVNVAIWLYGSDIFIYQNDIPDDII